MQGHAILFAALALGGLAGANAQGVDGGAAGSVERGRYLARIAGCNDCHTPGYSQSGGKTPESQWLTGDRLGWHGPWGTTYPANVRLAMAKMSEQEWVHFARNTQLRPPMPWFALRDMSTDDLLALHRFVRQLGPVGEPAPAYLPPTQTPQGPVVRFP
jgi:mono/diheme cytochrome c family protein